MISIIKGNSVFWDKESLEKSEEAFGDIMLSVFQTIKLKNKEMNRDERLIFSFFDALYHEVHSLAIKSDIINYFLKNSNTTDLKRKNFLYLTSLVETYLTSLHLSPSKALKASIEKCYLEEKA